ncbi:unnamed protein product [Acanthoscelides obtectus]|uniref:PWWP domain-containing protein n=1 Tax=Acanthoscelides obtectus TaxID=200917 RepID=A0A9P0JRJ4_ACAOB|nr:unnamed protein product [Acanthoscelides obtectus]CAK1633964.1 hypothetical protein AOBTE_LOCUS8511 [Acanthoscelides obtectus]
MTEEGATTTLYKDGEIVWVKLGPSWWPGEAKNLESLPEEVATFKKPPLIVVKFFDEDLYEFVRSWSNIYPYNCEKKNEFIRKGLAAYRAKAPHMEKFPKDVSTAEVRIDGNPNILSDPEFMPKKKFNLNDLFQDQSPKPKKSKEKNKNKSTSSSNDTSHITHRRFLGTESLNDYRAYICIQYPGKDRTSGDPEDDEVIKINTEPDQQYKCCTCTFATKRLEVMIMHRKSHIQGVYVSTTPRKYKSRTVKRQKKHRPKVEGPKEKKRKVLVQSAEISPKVDKPQLSKELTSELLAEWDDDDEEEVEEESRDLTIQSEASEPSNCEDSMKVDQSFEDTTFQPVETRTIDTDNSEKQPEVSVMNINEENAAEEPILEEHIQKEQTKEEEMVTENCEAEAVLPENKGVATKREPRRASRWDVGAPEKKKVLEKNESEESESSTEVSINIQSDEETNSQGEHSKGLGIEASSSNENESKGSERKIYDKESINKQESKGTENESKKKDSKYSSKSESKSSEREPRNSSGGEFSNIGEKGTATDSKTLWKKTDKDKESKSSWKRKFNTNDDEPRSYGVGAKSPWRRKTPENEINTSERRKDRHSGSKNSEEVRHKNILRKESGDSESIETKVSESQIDKDIKSCFDFDEEDEEDPPISAAPVGRKIPRVIPERKKSATVEHIDDTPSKSDCLDNVSEKQEKFADDNLENTFKELMETTTVPVLPEVQNTLKCEQNFHTINTIKFPDKATPQKEEVATKLTNPKKRFVKSFEDFEMMQNNMKRKEETEVNEKKHQKVDTVETEFAESCKEILDVVMGSQGGDQIGHSPENVAVVKSSEEFIDHTKNSGNVELPAQRIEKKSQQPALEVTAPLISIETEQREGTTTTEGVDQKLDVIKSSEEKPPIIEKVVHPQLQPENNSGLSDKTGTREFRVVSPKSKLLTPKIQRNLKKASPISMKDVISNMAKEAEPAADLEAKVHFANLKSKIMSKIIEESKLSSASKSKIMSLMESDRNLETKHETEVSNSSYGNHSHQNKAQTSNLGSKDLGIDTAEKKPSSEGMVRTKTEDAKKSPDEEKNALKKATWLTRGSHPKKDKCFMKEAVVEPKKSLTREASTFLLESPSMSSSAPPPSHHSLALPSKSITEDTSQSVVLEEIPLPEEIAVADIPLPPEPPLDEQAEKPPLSSTENVTPAILIEGQIRPERVEEISQVTSKPLTVNVESVYNTFTSQSFKSEQPSTSHGTEKVSEVTLPVALGKSENVKELISEGTLKTLNINMDNPESTVTSQSFWSEQQSTSRMPEKLTEVVPPVELDKSKKVKGIVSEDTLIPLAMSVDNSDSIFTSRTFRPEHPSINHCTEQLTEVESPVELDKNKKVEETVSEDTLKPLSINVDNSDNIFTSQSFLSSTIDFSPIGMASASLPENAICLPPKKSKKRKQPPVDDEADLEPCKKSVTDSHPLIDDGIDWNTMKKAESVRKAPSDEEACTKLVSDTGMVYTQSCEAEVNGPTKEKEDDNVHFHVESSYNRNVSEKVTTDLHSFTGEIFAEHSKSGKNEEQGRSDQGHTPTTNQILQSQQTFQETRKDQSSILVDETEDKSVVEIENQVREIDTATSNEEENAKKLSEKTVDDDTSNSMLVGENNEIKQAFEYNEEEDSIGVKEPVLPSDRKGEQQYVSDMENVPIVVEKLIEESTVETVSEEQDLQLILMKGVGAVEGPVVQDDIEAAVVTDATELVMEETKKSQSIILPMEETVHLGKHKPGLRELTQVPLESSHIDHTNLQSVNQKSLMNISDKENVAEEHTNEVEIQCTSNSNDGIKFSIQTNLSNFSSQQEISAEALASLAEMKSDIENSDSNISPEAPISKYNDSNGSDLNVMTSIDNDLVGPSTCSSDVGLKKIHELPEMIHVEGNLTVVSEKDLADGQVEITTDQVISTKKPSILSNFSMDFSDSTNDSCITNVPHEYDSKGTEFTSNAITKETKPKCTKLSNTYGRLELLDILEGDSDNERKRQPKPSVINDDMCDFEDHIPSQIVCAKMLTSDLLKNDAPKTSISATTHKLLERLSETKNKPAAKADLRKSASILSKTKIKSSVVSEQVAKTSVKPNATDLDDIEDVKAFVIHKDLKKLQAEETVIEDVPEKTATGKSAGKAAGKKSTPTKSTKAKAAAGKAKILQQTIITPAGEIIQPNVTVQQDMKMTIAKSPQPILPTQAKPAVSSVVKQATVVATQAEENVFDINSMPIVLSDELLTPESIEKMPIIISSESTQTSETTPQEKVVVSAAGSTRPIVKKIIGKMATATTPSLISQSPKTTVKTAVKPRILSGSSSKVLKQVNPTMAGLPKPGKYIIVPQNPAVTAASKVITKKSPLKKTTNPLPTALAAETTGNKIMIVTNQQGQQQRLLLTPAQQRLLGCQTSGAKLTKTFVKGNVLQKCVSASTEATAPCTSGIIKSQPAMVSIPKSTNVTSTISSMAATIQKVGIVTQPESKGGPKRVQLINQKLHSSIARSPKTMFLKTPHSQTARKNQGTDEELDKQVAEQLEAIRASSGKFTTKQQLPKTSETKASSQKPSKRLNARKSETKAKLPVSQINKVDSCVAPSPVVSTAKSEIGTATISRTKEESQPCRPLNQLVIQDAMGNQTTITEGQILALPSETVDGQPQSYMLVTLDESGNLTPLNNEALMSLDPNLGLAGDLSNMVLQIDQGGLQTCGGSIIEQKLPITQQAAVKSQQRVDEKPEQPSVLDTERMPNLEARTEVIEPTSGQKASITGPTFEAITTTPATEPPNQQLILTGDPIATQKFLESLSEGTTDLANILANADSNSILIQADGQQILINTNSDNQMLFGLGDSAEEGGNPIFASQPVKNQDILAAALADTDMFQSEQRTQGKIISQLSPNNAPYPVTVGNVLETSLTLGSPIMTPLEVPSTNNKKITDDEAEILTQLPKNVDLPITVTDPNISQTVANQQVASLIANELQSNLELGLPISEASIATVSNDINSPSYSYSLPSLEESVEITTHKSFNSSMPLLNEDVENSADQQKDKDDAQVEDKAEVKPDDSESIDSKKQEDSLNSDGPFFEDEGRFTLGGEMCSSLSEPPPEMFDIPEVNTSFSRRLRNNDRKHIHQKKVPINMGPKMLAYRDTELPGPN